MHGETLVSGRGVERTTGGQIELYGDGEQQQRR
jgi:hypothetical protein